MVRYVGDGRSKVKAQLCLLCVADVVDVIEDSGNKVVDSCLGNVVASNDYCCDSNCGDVFGSIVDFLGDGVLLVVGVGSDQAVDVILVEGDEVDLLAGAQVLNSGGGSACYDECCVDLAVLEAVGGVTEVEVLGLDVVFGQAVCAEEVKCVEVNAGALCADGNGLALEVGNGLDVGIESHDLDLLHVKSCDYGEVGHFFGEELLAVVSIAHNVGLYETELSIAACNILNVCLRAVAGQSGDAGRGLVGDLLCQNGAEGIVGALLAAGHEVEADFAVILCVCAAVISAVRASAQREDHNNSQKHSYYSFHDFFLLLNLNFLF